MEALWEAQETTLDEMETLTRQNGAREADDVGAGAGGGVGIDPGEVYSPAAREPERLNARNYRIMPADRLGVGSLKQKARKNFAAIELAHRLDQRKRSATDDERRVLVRYVAWAASRRSSRNFRGEEWQPERAELKLLLRPDEYETARASILNAH